MQVYVGVHTLGAGTTTCTAVGRERVNLLAGGTRADLNAVLEIIKVNWASAAEQKTDSDSRTAQRAPR